MAFLPTAFLLSLLLAVHGEYLQPPEILIRSNFFTRVDANSTCVGVSYVVLTPSGATNSTDTCNSDPSAATDGVSTTQWLSAPGDNVVELSIGLSVSLHFRVQLWVRLVLAYTHVCLCIDRYLVPIEQRLLTISFSLHVLVLRCTAFLLFWVIMHTVL